MAFVKSLIWEGAYQWCSSAIALWGATNIHHFHFHPSFKELRESLYTGKK